MGTGTSHNAGQAPAKESKMDVYTKEEITDAYSKLIWAQGLVDFILLSGLPMGHENKAVLEGGYYQFLTLSRTICKKLKMFWAV
jgi:hypothetical protein